MMLQRVLQKQNEAPLLCIPIVLEPRGRGSGGAISQTSDLTGLLSAATMAWPGAKHLVLRRTCQKFPGRPDKQHPHLHASAACHALQTLISLKAILIAILRGSVVVGLDLQSI